MAAALLLALATTAGVACAPAASPVKAGRAPNEAPRVLLVGDSILVQPAPTIVEQLDALGVVTRPAAVSGTGLLTGAVDWQAHAERLVERFRPDVVVVLFVGNYPENTPVDPGFDDDGSFPVDEHGTPIAADTSQFFDAWQRAARALSRTLTADGARVYWVEPPPMLEWDPLHRADELYAGYRRLGADDDTIGYLSPRALLAGPDGQWISETLACGAATILRDADTVHFSDDGARRYGYELARLLTEEQGWGRIPPSC